MEIKYEEKIDFIINWLRKECNNTESPQLKMLDLMVKLDFNHPENAIDYLYHAINALKR